MLLEHPHRMSYILCPRTPSSAFQTLFWTNCTPEYSRICTRFEWKFCGIILLFIDCHLNLSHNFLHSPARGTIAWTEMKCSMSSAHQWREDVAKSKPISGLTKTQSWQAPTHTCQLMQLLESIEMAPHFGARFVTTSFREEMVLSKPPTLSRIALTRSFSVTFKIRWIPPGCSLQVS